MNKIFITFIISVFAILTSSCGEEPVVVEPMKKTDRELSCSDIMLEINDAEFYKKQAEEKKSLGVKSIVMPLGYIDTYMNADEAIIAADSRREYLSRVAEIKGCGNPSNYNTQRNSNNLQTLSQPVIQQNQMPSNQSQNINMEGLYQNNSNF
ncbi:MAG: hypothetical protein SFT90_08490 [Rickettsiales bacterium]|nr:hypothetical protein [Rickettsiales bacterium]